MGRQAARKRVARRLPRTLVTWASVTWALVTQQLPWTLVAWALVARQPALALATWMLVTLRLGALRLGARGSSWLAPMRVAAALATTVSESYGRPRLTVRCLSRGRAIVEALRAAGPVLDPDSCGTTP